jgi:hypothetical protein
MVMVVGLRAPPPMPPIVMMVMAVGVLGLDKAGLLASGLHIGDLQLLGRIWDWLEQLGVRLGLHAHSSIGGRHSGAADQARNRGGGHSQHLLVHQLCSNEPEAGSESLTRRRAERSDAT